MTEAAHLIRLAAVLVAALLVFAFVRAEVVPASFGQYGHYRGDSLAENRNKKIAYAGRAACATCHEEVLTVLTKTRHAAIGCETCHGPRAHHTEDPTITKGALPVASKLCVHCHEANPARPQAFRQVNSKEHSGGESCNTCHQAHAPKVGG